MKVSIVNNGKHDLPNYATTGSAGLDLRANIEKDIILNSGERLLVGTGLHLELPVGYEAQIRPRSGLAYKNGVTVLNSPGTIDSDYRGEIKVLLINLSNNEFIIKDGERIAQMIIASYRQVSWQSVEVVDALGETKRGTGGYGSTGIQ